MADERAYFMVGSIDGKHDAADLKNRLNHMHGIHWVKAEPSSGCMAVHYNSAGISYDKIENCVNKMGCEIKADASDIHTI